ncbi:MAG: STAS domain-containing protein [Spirochaetales bacterium]|jgi:SulP family sulfate permease|nr:STAS domain-containing protein [Spirochaetales bacterium]
MKSLNPGELVPELFTLLKEGIPRRQLLKELSAGVVVGVLALPLAIAFAIASGVSPEKGIITAIITGFIISAFGGSRVQIGGPTGAFVVLVASTLHTFGYAGLAAATFMAGIILVLLGLLRMGALLKYVPRTMIVGFTTGIAVIIFSTQVQDFLGLTIESVPGDFLGKWGVYFSHLDTLNPWALALGTLSIVIVVFIQRSKTLIPGPLAALIVSTLAVSLFNLPVETIGSRFGSLAQGFPAPAFPALDPGMIRQLFRPAVSIALLGALESLLSAMVADGMIGSRHRPNAELLAQGLANMVSPLFGGIPATGAIARTATNVNAGGRTPLAGIIHGLTLLVIFLAAMPLVKLVPIPALSGILLVVCWNMSDFKTFRRQFKVNKYEVLVLLITFFLTILEDLTVAILSGFVLSLLVFMKRMADSVSLTPLIADKEGEDMLLSPEGGAIPRNVLIFQVEGPLFFGSVAEFLNIEKHLLTHHRVVILCLEHVPIMDATGLNRLGELIRELEKKQVRIILSGASHSIKDKILDLDLLIEADYILPDLKASLQLARRLCSPETKSP